MAAQRPEQRAAQDQAQLAAEVDLHPVGRPGAAVAEVLQLPAPVDRLQGAVLLGPGDPVRSLEAEVHLRLQVFYARVGLHVEQRRIALVVALDALGDLDLRLPARRALDVGGDRVDRLDRRLDLGTGGALELAHGRSLRAGLSACLSGESRPMPFWVARRA